MSHYVVKCADHGRVYGQCRCPSQDKAVRLVTCRCKPLPPPVPGTEKSPPKG